MSQTSGAVRDATTVNGLGDSVSPFPGGSSGAAAGAGLLGPVDIQDLAGVLGIRPTKTLGQNFVHDAGTLRRIVRRAGVLPGETVLEIGPGLGSLTLALLEAGARVIAVEIDPQLARALPVTVARRMPEAADGLRVVCADALSIDGPGALGLTPADAAPVRLVANLPYNVAVPVLLTLLAAVPSLEAATVMVQAEVADRLAAPPGSRTYGVPSVKVAWYAAARRTITVGRTVFWPVPNVDSALVELVRREPPAASFSPSSMPPSLSAARPCVGRSRPWPVDRTEPRLPSSLPESTRPSAARSSTSRLSHPWPRPLLRSTLRRPLTLRRSDEPPASRPGRR